MPDLPRQDDLRLRLLFARDVARLTGMKSEAAARKRMARGDYGMPLRIGRRIAVRASDYLAALKHYEILPPRPPRSPSLPTPRADLLADLQPRERGTRGRREGPDGRAPPVR